MKASPPASATTRAKAASAKPAPKPARRAPGNLDRASAGAMPLPLGTRLRAEASLGVPLSAVRIDRDSRAPARNGAEAVSEGLRIQLAPRASAAALAHELVHVAQGIKHGTAPSASAVDRPGSPAEAEARRLSPQVAAGARVAVRRRRDARIHRKPPEGEAGQFVITPVGANLGALPGYPALQAIVGVEDWNGLSAAARRRAETIAGGGKAPPGENEVVKREIKLPLFKIFWPATGVQGWEAGGDAWMRDIYRLGTGSFGGAGIAERMQQEMLGRWLKDEKGILSEEVTVALIDPEGKGTGPAGLVFLLRGKPVNTTDGLLLAAEVDRSQNGRLPGIVTAIRDEAAGLESAINAARKASVTLQAAKDVIAKGDPDIAANLFDQGDVALRERSKELAGITSEPFKSLVAPVAADLKTCIDTTLPARRKSHQEWRDKNPRQHSSYEVAFDNLDKGMAKKDPSIFEAMMMGYTVQDAQRQAQTDLMMGGALSQESQLGKAYDAGKISFAQYEQAADAVMTRGAIIGGINAALMIASMGLGLVVAPAGLGAQVAFGIGTGIVTATVPLLAANTYTYLHDLPDPAMQQWWKDSSYSAWDITKAGLIGGAIGGAFPIAAKAVGALAGRFGGGASAYSRMAAGELALPEGAIGRTIGRDAMEIVIASEGVTIEVSKSGFKVYGPAGKAGKVLLQSGSWAEMGHPAPGVQPTLVSYRDFNATLGFGRSGWSLGQPGTRNPMQVGLWNELALPAPQNSALVPQAGPVPIEGKPGASLIYAGGTGPPIPQPPPLFTLAGPSNPLGLLGPGAGGLTPSYPGLMAPPYAQWPALPPGQQPFGLLPAGSPQLPPYPGMMAPPYAQWPALPPGPQPFGLLPPPSPQIDYVGPVTPPNYANATALTTPYQQYGSSILPPTAPGGLYIRDGSGALRYVAHPGSPAFQGGITAYGGGGPQDYLVNTGSYQSVLVQPNPITFAGGRGYPMQTIDMRFGTTPLARSHLAPHADTKLVLPGQTLSTRDPANYVGHPRPYNERIRRTLEGRFRREGTAWGAYNVLGQNPRLTQGGFVVPDGEFIVQFTPTGKIWRAWYFPFDNLNRYNGLGGDIDTILGGFEIAPGAVPVGKLGP